LKNQTIGLVVLLSLFTSVRARAAAAPVVCSISINSTDERETFRKHLGTLAKSVTELLPERPGVNWFAEACAFPIPCDTLIISGHFGGRFFGSGAATLGLDELQGNQCRSTCGNLMNAKNVFLMGCNTLAEKTIDKRSPLDYINVLLWDGFTSALAESTAANRYAHFGMSMAEKMAVAFWPAEHVYGFTSTGPLGAEAAPRLSHAMTDRSRDFNAALLEAFSDTSFTEMTSAKEITRVEKDLVCSARGDAGNRAGAFASILTSDSPKHYFDLLLQAAMDGTAAPVLANSWNSLDQAAKDRVLSAADKIWDEASEFLNTRYQLLRFRHVVGVLSDADYTDAVRSVFRSLVAQYDYLGVDQACGIARGEPTLKLTPDWLPPVTPAGLPYYERLVGCFSQVDPAVLAKVENLIRTSANPSVRREGLRALKADGVSGSLVIDTSNWSARDRTEAQADHLAPADAAPAGFKECAQAAGANPWACFNSYKGEAKTLSSCLAMSSVFRGTTGADWDCVAKFDSSLQLGVCSKIGNHYSDDQTHDDFLGHCWQTVRNEADLDQAECLGFTQSMRLEGNAIKQNWNCQHQVAGARNPQ
jgi:hypothetical protein